MDKNRKIRKVIKSKPTIEGAGVHLRRAFGFSEVPAFDPFLLLDDFRSNDPKHFLQGFPWHPHRGIETITYVLRGNVEHGDSRHRVLGAKQGVVVRDCATYVKALEKDGVIPEPERRRAIISEQISTLCKKTGFVLNQDDALLDQAVYTTEWPYAIIGSFNMYLDVQEEILITSMKEHQGFFSLRHKTTGKLVAHFIAVANNRVKDMGLIREGNERVLAARLADAKFFYDDDRTTTLQDRVGKLDGVTFHQKIGTMGQKQARIATLAATLARLAGLNESVVKGSERAGALCKADLLTGIVGEFPELQGVMGGYYARHDGEAPAVCQASLQHYRPQSMDGAIPETTEA